MKIKIDKHWTVNFPPEFFLSPFHLRLDLSEAQFTKWQSWWFEELVQCDMWSCCQEEELHAVENMCAIESMYSTYVTIAKNIPSIIAKGIVPYYPMYDPLQAYHIPGSGWESAEGSPVKKDLLKGWDKHFPKRSCVNCTGRYGDVSEKICTHDPADGECDAGCFENKFQSWCPFMNDFMEKQDWAVDKSLEKFAKNPDQRVFPEELANEEDLLDMSHAPKVIQEFMKDAVEKKGDDQDERRKQSRNN